MEQAKHVVIEGDLNKATRLTEMNLRALFAIGLLDRALSELKMLALDPMLDSSDAQTVKHHAEDCVGLGQRVLKILEKRKKVIGWYDHFNDVTYKDEESAKKAELGGNKITRLTVFI